MAGVFGRKQIPPRLRLVRNDKGAVLTVNRGCARFI
jgi:hypothetical protein